MKNPKSIKMRFLYSFLICLLAACNLNAQNDNNDQSINTPNNNDQLTDKEKTEVVQSIARLLNENYVFPDVAKEMDQLITGNLAEGKYDEISDPQEFSLVLTQDLFSVSKDKHLRVNFSPETVREIRESNNSKKRSAFLNSQVEKMKNANYGFKEVKILEGNIGYINLTNFFPADYAGETAVKAMHEVSNVKSLIIDLRYNGGGSPSMIQLITSYFFDEKPVHLNTFYRRPTNEYTETWTFSEVKGKRMTDVDIYILTSDRTFSAAEEFSYNLKNLGRAILIGETTGGGAHPGGQRIATDRYLVWVPTGRAINPITNTNWEGIGVIPHIPTSEERAFEVAYEKAKQ